jgi:hypothetical protein
LYLKSVSRAYFDFWFLPNFIEYWDLNKIKLKFVSSVLSYAIKAELYFWLVLNLLFIITGVYYIYLYYRKKYLPASILVIFLYFTVILLSVIQALVQYGDNWRFSVAIKPYILLAVIFFAYNMWFFKSKEQQVN